MGFNSAFKGLIATLHEQPLVFLLTCRTFISSVAEGLNG